MLGESLSRQTGLAAQISVKPFIQFQTFFFFNKLSSDGRALEVCASGRAVAWPAYTKIAEVTTYIFKKCRDC